MIPTLLVPGLLCTPEIFAPQIPSLWTHGPVMVANTMRGDTIAEIGARILAAAPDRFCLAGISMGGYIAFEIMRQAPGRVEKLALLSTSARADTPEQTEQRLRMLDLAREDNFPAIIGEASRFMVHPTRRQNSDIVQTTRRMAAEMGYDTFERQQRAIIGRIDSRPFLHRIAVPTLVLVGDADPLTPPERAAEIKDLIASASLTVVAGCGHASTLEQPSAVTEALVRWLVTF